MSRRFLKIQNYRNIGVTKELEEFQTLYLNNTLNKDEMGELIILIGENNVGKSNILDAVNVIRPIENIKSIDFKKDIPDFMDYEDAKPRIKLIYADENKSPEIEYFLDENKNIKYEFNNPKELRYLELEYIKKEFEINITLLEDNIELSQDINIINTYKLKINNILENYDNILNNNHSNIIDEIKMILKKLEKVNNEYNECIKKYNLNLSKISFKDLDPDEHHKQILEKNQEKYNINFIPNIIYYKEEELKNSDLITTPENIKNSSFFNSLFKAIDKDVDTVEISYAKDKEIRGYKDQFQNNINEKLNKVVSKKFNDLYFQGLNTQEYNFRIKFEKDEIYLYIQKNGHIISLQNQSVGFKWFFNFFFNFLYSNKLNAGDIVLIDEPDAHLALPAVRDLRNFIKKFARNNGITFIVTTHNPSFIDIDYLDELRIVKFKKDKTGVEIQNDFSVIAENEVDTLNEIINGFGILHRDIITNPNNKVIFVEGLMDYNYLTAFKKLKEEKENKKINLVFLPICGLGKDDEKMNKKLEHLVQFREAIILTDSDERANLFKKASESTSLMKERLTVFQLKEVDPSFKQIESLFSDNDKKRYIEMIQNKSGSLSSLFKNNILNRELDKETMNNFNRLLNYLSDMVLTDNSNNYENQGNK